MSNGQFRNGLRQGRRKEQMYDVYMTSFMLPSHNILMFSNSLGNGQGAYRSREKDDEIKLHFLRFDLFAL